MNQSSNKGIEAKNSKRKYYLVSNIFLFFFIYVFTCSICWSIDIEENNAK